MTKRAQQGEHLVTATWRSYNIQLVSKSGKSVVLAAAGGRARSTPNSPLQRAI
jgi:hypothetical protein